MLRKFVSPAEGVLALRLLAGLQSAISWSSVRSEGRQRLNKSEPILLVHDGPLFAGAIRTQRVTREEIVAVLRASGEPELEAVAVLARKR